MTITKRTYLAVLAVLLSPMAANADLIMSSADPALTGSNVIDFEGTATQDNTSFTFGDVTFSTTGGTLRIAPFGEGGSNWMGSGQTLTTRNTTGASSFVIDFAVAVSAFGMNWGAANPDWNVNLYDVSNNLLESLVFAGGNFPLPGTFSEFYGGSNGGGIARVELQTVGGFDWVIIDDFQYVPVHVPEPSTLALLGIGLLGMGLARRRKEV